MQKTLAILALSALPVLGQLQAADALEILPSRVELTPGEETQFGLRLRCSGFALPTLQTSCTGGTLDSSGRYRAPMEPGVHQIRVWALDRPGMVGTATVLVLPMRLPSIERFDYIAPSREVAWKVEGAQEVRMEPGASGLASEGQSPVPAGSDWITLWASNEIGSTTKVLSVPQTDPAPNPTVIHAAEPVPEPAPVASASAPGMAPLPWSLQLVVLAEDRNVQKLRDAGFLDQPGVFTFEIVLTNGRRATCICYGRFPSRKEAVLAARRLPMHLRPEGLQPHPRTVPLGSP